jgi:hypothetical protein
MAIGLASSAATVSAQTVPVGPLGAVEARSTDSLGAIAGVRELSDGRVLVNDPATRRLLLFDRALAHGAVVVDSARRAATSYGALPSGIIAYAGDSTLLVDRVGRAFLVIDGAGRVARVMSPPRPDDAPYLVAGAGGTPAIDPQGRLVYRTIVMPAFRPPEVGKAFVPPAIADSSPLVRADFDRRSADTVAWLRTPRMKVATEYLPNGGVRLTPILSPVSVVDDWTLLPDGTIAVVRGQDYHVDWIAPDGARTSSARLPFDWRRLTDADKTALLDSARRALERPGAAAATMAAAGHPGAPSTGPAGQSMTIIPIGAADGAPPPKSSSAAAVPPLPATTQLVTAADVPDYLPPLARTGTTRADRDGNVWIVPATSAEAGEGVVYDVVNRKGELVERVRLPAGRVLAGFGADGVVYLSAYGAGGVGLARARVR